MAADDPIRIGAAALTSLITESGSHIATDDFGVQHGTVRHFLGDQSLAQSSRFSLGTSYSGSLPQYSGFFVEKSGDITGIDGKCANLDVQYARLDPLWVNIPKRTHDLQLVNIRPADLGTGYGELYDTFVQMIIPIPHPVITYKYASASYPSSLATYGTPVNAPTVPDFLFRPQFHDFTSTSLDIEQRVVSGTATLITLDITDGTCVRSTYPYSSTVTGVFSQLGIGLINLFNLNFTADPNGWFCLKEDVTPTGAGAFYLIEQQWKRNYIFNGTSAGTWWQGGGHQIRC
jgi:hypothetical protein